jgi:hypothetical protein
MDIIYNLSSYYQNYKINLKNCSNNPINPINPTNPANQVNLNIIKNVYSSANIFLNDPVRIIDRIYIGNIFNVSNWAVIRDYNFNYIINLTNNVPNYWDNVTNVTYVNIDLSNILNNLNQDINYNEIIKCIELIEEFQSREDTTSQNQSNILIHSNLDINSSVVIVGLYMVYKYNLSIAKYYNLLRKKNIILDDQFKKIFINIISICIHIIHES